MITEQTKHSSFVFIRWHCRYFFRNYSWNKSFNEEILTFYSFCIALTLWFKIGNTEKKTNPRYGNIEVHQSNNFCNIGINFENFLLTRENMLWPDSDLCHMNVDQNILCIHVKLLFKSVLSHVNRNIQLQKQGILCTVKFMLEECVNFISTL